MKILNNTGSGRESYGASGVTLVVFEIWFL